MTEIVVVPALRGRPLAVTQELADWVSALAAGLRRTETDEGEALADTLLVGLAGGPERVRVATYFDLFASEYDEPPTDPAVLALAEQLARGLLEQAATSADPELRREARQALEEARADGMRQSAAGRAVAPATEILNRNTWLAWAMVGVSGDLGTRVREGARYALEPGMRRRVRQRVMRTIASDTRIVIGYGSGSVVAYEACHQLSHPLHTLVTLGSPLGMGSVLYPHLEPQPPSWPGPVGRWLNVAHPDDVMAARPDIHGMYPSGDGRRVEVVTPASPAHVHSATAYLAHPVVGSAVVRALQDGDQAELDRSAAHLSGPASGTLD